MDVIWRCVFLRDRCALLCFLSVHLNDYISFHCKTPFVRIITIIIIICHYYYWYYSLLYDHDPPARSFRRCFDNFLTRSWRERYKGGTVIVFFRIFQDEGKIARKTWLVARSDRYVSSSLISPQFILYIFRR